MSRGIKERKERREANRDKRPYAIARYIRIPNSKVKFVLDLIRGKSYEDAVNLLKNLNKSSSPVVLKVLNSAAANAENNLAMSKDNLYVAECYATNAPQMKRMMPRARGRADRILKRSCHITIRLGELKVGQKVNKPVKTAEQKATATTKTTAKPVPTTKAEKPLTDQPNTVKPLGTKAVATEKKTTAAKKTAASTPKKTTTAAKKEAK